MENQTSQITAIGHIASQVLERNSEARVAGTSSQGIYLQPQDDLSFFLSPDHFRGPLTINVSGLEGSRDSIRPGDQTLIDGGGLRFPERNVMIHLQGPLVWTPPRPPVSKNYSNTLLGAAASQARSLASGHPYLFLLEMLDARAVIPRGENAGLENRLRSLFASMNQGDRALIGKAMEGLLGAGPGLTPLGDDLLLGILLMDFRAQSDVERGSSPALGTRSLLAAARQKTSTLSWSLLESAAEGSADERILRVGDGLLSGAAIPDQDVLNLLEWGSSSGIAVLVGMLLVLARAGRDFVP